MSLSLRPYPEYRDSGLPWQGPVPAHWRDTRVKYLLREVDERTSTGEEPLLSLRQNGGLVPFNSISGRRIAPEFLVGYKLVQPGDLVLNRLQANNGLFGVADETGLVSPDYAVFRTRTPVDLRYLVYLFKTPVMRTRFRVESKGLGSGTAGFLRLYTDRFGAMGIALPPLDEQRRIADFLDGHGRVLTALVRNRLHLRSLIDARRHHIIADAITSSSRTASPEGARTGERKEAPEAWRTVRLRHLVRSIDQGPTPPSVEGLADEITWGVLKSGCVNGGFFREDENKRLRSDYVVDSRNVVHVGDVIVSRASGSRELVGSAAIVTSMTRRLILSDKTFRLNLEDERLSEFVAIALNSRYVREQIEPRLSGADGLPSNIPLPLLKNIRLVVPGPGHATQVVELLRAELSAIDRALQTIDRKVALLRDYRNSLVVSAVTGGVDLRTVEPDPLPAIVVRSELEADLGEEGMLEDMDVIPSDEDADD